MPPSAVPPWSHALWCAPLMSLLNGRFPLKALDCAIRSDSREVLRSSWRCHWWALLGFLLITRGTATQREWTDSLALVSLLLKVSCQQTGPPSERSLTGRCLLLIQCSSRIRSCGAANNRSEETRVQLTSHCWMWLMSVQTWNHWVIQTETIQSGKTKHLCSRLCDCLCGRLLAMNPLGWCRFTHAWRSRTADSPDPREVVPGESRFDLRSGVLFLIWLGFSHNYFQGEKTCP